MPEISGRRSHRRLYTCSPNDYKEISGIWSNDEVALPDDPPGKLEVVEGMPEGGKIQQLVASPLPSRPITLRKKCMRSRQSSTTSRGGTGLPHPCTVKLTLDEDGAKSVYETAGTRTIYLKMIGTSAGLRTSLHTSLPVASNFISG